MDNHSKNYRQKKLQIRGLETTADRITGRAGLVLFVAYLHRIKILPWIDRWFGAIRKNGKGLTVVELFKQVLCFMVDGTSRRLTYFDQLAKDQGYVGGDGLLPSGEAVFQSVCLDADIFVSAPAANAVYLATAGCAARCDRTGWRDGTSMKLCVSALLQ